MASNFISNPPLTFCQFPSKKASSISSKTISTNKTLDMAFSSRLRCLQILGTQISFSRHCRVLRRQALWLCLGVLSVKQTRMPNLKSGLENHGLYKEANYMCVFSSSFYFCVSLEQLGGGRGFLANLRNFEDDNTNGSLFVQIICIFIGDTFKFQAKILKHLH